MSALDEDDSRSSGPVLADSLDLSLDPMPTGATLLAPGEPAPKDNARASAYGCYLASRPYSDEVAFHSKYLHFPESVVEEAGTDTRRVEHRVQVGIDEDNASEGVRYMHCVIPDSDQAADLAREQILDIGLEQAAREVMDEAEASQSKSTCFIQVDYTTICWGNDTGSDCKHEQHVDIICHEGGSGGSSGDNGSGSESSPWPDDPDESDVGGSPDDGGSSDGGTCTELIPEPGSDCEPIDPCESDNPPFYCEPDEEEDEEETLCLGDPVANPEIAPSGGWNYPGGQYGHTRNGGERFHDGIDIRMEPNTNLFSAYSGEVVHTIESFDPGEYARNSYGNTVTIETNFVGETIQLTYAHLNSVKVDVGDIVQAGDQIGLSGETGNANDEETRTKIIPHVHIKGRLKKNESLSKLDPGSYLATKFNSDGSVKESCK